MRVEVHINGNIVHNEACAGFAKAKEKCTELIELFKIDALKEVGLHAFVCIAGVLSRFVELEGQAIRHFNEMLEKEAPEELHA